MIDTWFNNDIQEVFSKHSVVVFIDESGAAEFLLKSLDKDCTVHYVSNDVDELKAKYIIEKNYKSSQLLHISL